MILFLFFVNDETKITEKAVFNEEEMNERQYSRMVQFNSFVFVTFV